MKSDSDSTSKFSSPTFAEVVYKIKWIRCMTSRPTTDEDISLAINISQEKFTAYMCKIDDAPKELIDALLNAYNIKRVTIQHSTVIDLSTEQNRKNDLNEEV